MQYPVSSYPTRFVSPDPSFHGQRLPSNLSSILGVTCHEKPNLSLSQPHASASGTADSLFPVMIDFFLGLAIDDKGNRLAKTELMLMRTVHGGKLLSKEFEGTKFDRASLVRFLAFFVAHKVVDLRFGEIWRSRS